MEDLLRITEDFEVVQSRSLLAEVGSDEGNQTVEHWDAVQIIPRGYPSATSRLELPLSWRPQYALAEIYGAGVVDCTIIESRNWNNVSRSDPKLPSSAQKSGSLQAVTCFDGLLRRVIISDNLISVGSSHEITLHGAMSGVITGNCKLNVGAVSPPAGYPLIIRLRSALVGGAPKGLLLTDPKLRTQMHILSWKAGTYWPDTGEPILYEPIKGGASSVREGFKLAGGQLVIDQRTALAGSPQDRYLFNFDLLAWYEHMLEHLPKAEACYGDDVDAFCGWLQQEACLFGEMISGDSRWQQPDSVQGTNSIRRYELTS